MDNGQIRQEIKNESESVPVFFTAGSGVHAENVNPDAGESLNTSNFSEQSQHDFGRVGNVAINRELINGDLVPRPEQTEISASEVDFTAPEPPKSPFEIISESEPQIETAEAESIVDLDALKVDKNDHLPSIARKAINKGLRQFDSNEISPANLVDLRWVASKAYLKNSYNRDIGETA